MKKILLVTTVPSTIRSFLLPLADRLRQDKWIVHAMASGITEQHALTNHFDMLWDIDFSRDPMRAIPRIPASLRRIEQILEKEKYAIVHTHTPIASMMIRFGASRVPATARPKVIYTAHGFHFHSEGGRLSNLMYFEAEKVAARWTDMLLVINEEDYANAVKKNLISAGRIKKIPGIGVDVSCFDPERYTERDVLEKQKELGIPSEKKIFLFPAEFNPGKRHIDAIEAMELTRREDASLLFAGSGKLEDAMKKYVEKRALCGQVKFLGDQEDIPLLLKMSIALISPSLREGLPRVILEAMSMNTPVIATDIRGSRDLLKSGCGMLVPPRSPQHLANAMTWILENEEEAKQMGMKGRPAVLRTYDEEVVLARQKQIIDELINEPALRNTVDPAQTDHDSL